MISVRFEKVEVDVLVVVERQTHLKSACADDMDGHLCGPVFANIAIFVNDTDSDVECVAFKVLVHNHNEVINNLVHAPVVRNHLEMASHTVNTDEDLCRLNH